MLFGAVVGRFGGQDEPARQRLLEFFRRAADGLPTTLGSDPTPFYVLGLSAESRSRVTVRCWYSSTVAAISRRIIEVQRALAIGASQEAEVSGVTAREIVNATARIGSDGKTDDDTADHTLLPAVVGTFIKQSTLPESLLNQTIRRVTSDGYFTTPRMAVIKCCLVQRSYRMDPYLDKTHPSSAYHCGRIMAIIEFAQDRAIPNVKASVVRRNLGAAMSAPGITLPRLLKTAEMAYFPKIDEPVRGYLEDLLAFAHSALQSQWPDALRPRDQGLFLLGLYQQRLWLEDSRNVPRAGWLERTKRGEWVRSRGERRIADIMCDLDVSYAYEPRAILVEGPNRYPDFVLVGVTRPDDVYIEYLGVRGRPEYDRRWEAKLAAYTATKITTGGGENGRLVVIDDRNADTPMSDVDFHRVLGAFASPVSPQR